MDGALTVLETYQRASATQENSLACGFGCLELFRSCVIVFTETCIVAVSLFLYTYFSLHQ